MIKKANWDSNFFGYDVGQYRIDSNENVDLDRLLDESKKFKLIYVVSEKELAFNGRFELVDIKATLYKLCDGLLNLEESNDGILIEEFDNNIHSYKELQELSFLSGKYSRFNIDKNFQNNEFKRLYREWIDRSIDHTIATKVLVCVLENHILGFVTVGIKNDFTSRIGLISVDPRYQGRNIGSVLIKTANDFCRNNGIEFIEVATQKENFPAMKLYQKNGFELKSYEYIYHIWNS